MSIGRRLRRQAGRTISIGKANLAQIHLDARYAMSAQQFSRILDQLSSSQRDFVLENPLPKSYKEIRKVVANKETRREDYSLNTNFEWYLKSMQPYSLHLRNYLVQKSRYESHLLKGEYAEALTTIELVNSTICYSQWAINQVIITNEYNGGLKSNKIATGDFQSDDIEGVVRTIAYFQSLRSEKNMPLYQFSEIFESALKEGSELDKEYYKFKLIPSNEGSTSWGMIMKVDARSSVIDRYNTFIEICLYLSSTEDDANNFEELLPWIKRMYEIVPDPLLHNLLLMHNSIREVEIDHSTVVSCEVNNLFYSGEYAQAIEVASKGLIQYPYLIELYELYILASIYTSKDLKNPFAIDSIAFHLIQDIYNVFCKNKQVSNALSNLLKHCYTFKGTRFSWEIFQIFCKHYSIEGGNINIRKASIACGALANPDAISFSMKLDLLHKHPLFRNSTILNIYSGYIKNVYGWLDADLGNIDLFQKKLIEIDILFFKQKMELALEAINQTLDSHSFQSYLNIKYNKDYLLHVKAVALLSLSRFGDAIRWVASANLAEEGFHSRLGNRHLISVALMEDSDDINLSIFTPILLTQYALNYKISTNDIWIAFDNFMLGIGEERPSELRNHVDDIDKLALVYFLKNVCLQETLGKSYNVYESEDDLDNERMAVLGFLCEIDPSNFEEYIRELQHLSSNIEIRKGIKQINESKIYVDVTGIQLATGQELRDTFNRAIELDSLNIPEIEMFLDILGDNFSVLNVQEVNNKKQLVATSAQDIKYTSNLLKYNYLRLFIKIRDMFISHSDFGLDSYISMRIRHGALDLLRCKYFCNFAHYENIN